MIKKKTCKRTVKKSSVRVKKGRWGKPITWDGFGKAKKVGQKRCQAITNRSKGNKQCKNLAYGNSMYCKKHQK